LISSMHGATMKMNLTKHVPAGQRQTHVHNEDSGTP
jgi:hypothetical protein